MRYLVLVMALALGGCMADEMAGYGAPPRVAPVAPVAVADPELLAPTVLAPLRPYQPPALAPIPNVPMQTLPGVLPPIRPVTLQ